MAKQLTNYACKNMRPDKARREVPDGGCAGLFFIVQTSGHKSFAMRFRQPNGKPAKLTLGPLDTSDAEAATEPALGQPLTLAAARRLVTELHRQRAMGRDVIADLDAAKRRAKTERQHHAASTYAAAAHDWIQDYAIKHRRDWKEVSRLLGYQPTEEGIAIIDDGLADRWREKPMAAIDGDDIHSVVDETRRKGVPGLARRAKGHTAGRARTMYATLSALCGWLVKQRRLAVNPCNGVHKPATPTARDRVLTNAELAQFWSAATKRGEPFGQLLKLLLLTGCRLNEVAGMRKPEFSDDKTWTIPGTRTKNKRAHVLPLPVQAVALLATVKRIESRAGLIFTTTGKTPVSGWSRLKENMDADMADVPPWTFHDLRRTAATGMAGLGIPPHIVEACLNHISGAKAGVAGTYNRAAYLPEKKAAFARWAAHVDRLVSGRQAARVVPLR